MQTSVIQRQYDEIIANRYDIDPHSVIGNSLRRAVVQIRALGIASRATPLRVLDVGLGTGRFLRMLMDELECDMQPHGLDLSPKMIAIARERIPGLIATTDDAANLDEHFDSDSFDLISTHFVTGFVPMEILAPKIWSRLDDGAYWSLVGGTKAGFPTLQKKANAKYLRWFFGGKGLSMDELVCNPADSDEVRNVLESHGFLVRASETFTPSLHFANLTEFMAFAYWGGWLTPFIEHLGLHQAKAPVRKLLNAFFFPVSDHHSIEIVLAQKTANSLRISR